MLKLTVIVICLLVALGAEAQDGKKSYADWSKFDPSNFDRAHTFSFEVGELRVVIGDAYAHADSGLVQYTGIHHLSSTRRPSNVFCPRYAGMIGIRRPCEIARVGKTGAVIWVGEGKQRVSEEYIVKAPYYIDHTARFTAGGTTGGWNDTSYMNGPKNPAIYLIQPDGKWVRHYSKVHGDGASVAPATMLELPPIVKVENPQYPHGSNNFSDSFSDLRFDPNYALFYGRFDNMVLIFMIERRWGKCLIPYMSPSGGGYSDEFARGNPAWDYRYQLTGLTPGEEVVIRSRVVYKPFRGRKDVLAEYDKWNAELEGK
jgi:hypothetical protein